MLSFAVYSNGKLVDNVNLAGSYVVGTDDVPLRAEITFKDGIICCQKRAAGPAGLALSWNVAGVGTIVLETVRLVEREHPYILQVELARARLMRISHKIEDWGLNDFEEVVEACAQPRMSQDGTWITQEMKAAYADLHVLGHANSIECWQNGSLAGGLYGVRIGQVFFGESMFSHQSDASKVALVYLVRQLQAWGFTLIDCQLPSPHLFRLGAVEIRRRDFLRTLDVALSLPDRAGLWRLDPCLQII